MAVLINDQVILEEDYDENYQPTEDGKRWQPGFMLCTFDHKTSQQKFGLKSVIVPSVAAKRTNFVCCSGTPGLTGML